MTQILEEGKNVEIRITELEIMEQRRTQPNYGTKIGI